MASLQERKRKNGKKARVVQLMLGKRRRSVFLDAKYPKRVAKEASRYVGELAKSAEFGLTRIDPERRVLIWLEELDDGLRQRLERAGLLSKRDVMSIEDLVERYFEAESPKLRSSSIVNKRNRLRRGEAFELRWEDINWDANRMKVRSPKTENVGKDRRIIPLFQLLKDGLEELRKSKKEPETGRVITSLSPVAIYQIFKKTISKAGVPV